VRVLAFDLGGTRLKAGFVEDRRCEPVFGDPCLEAVAAAGRALMEGHGPPDVVAMCVPGLVVDGRVTVLPGKLEGIVGRDLRAFLGAAFGVPVGAVVNDAHAFGWGEAFVRTNHKRVLTVTIGTGVGTCLVDKETGWAGGLLTGQMDAVDRECNAAALHALGPDAYRARLAAALADMCLAHQPDVVVLGGGPMHPGNEVLPGLAELVNERLAPWLAVDVELAQAGDAGGLVGVALLSGA